MEKKGQSLNQLVEQLKNISSGTNYPPKIWRLCMGMATDFTLFKEKSDEILSLFKEDPLPYWAAKFHKDMDESSKKEMIEILNKIKELTD